MRARARPICGATPFFHAHASHARTTSRRSRTRTDDTNESSQAGLTDESSQASLTDEQSTARTDGTDEQSRQSHAHATRP